MVVLHCIFRPFQPAGHLRQGAVLILLKHIERVEHDPAVLIAHHLGDLHGFSGFVTQPGKMYNDIYRRCDLLADGLQRKACRTLKDHGLQAAQHILGGVCMAGGE